MRCIDRQQPRDILSVGAAHRPDDR